MKEYLSPGIYTQEYDKSFLQSAPGIGPTAAFIGGFTKGRAFIPMLIKDGRDLIDRTGEPNGEFYSQYAALQYSKYKGNFWVQRLLWQDVFTSDALVIYGTSGSDATQGDVLAVLLPTSGDTITINSTQITASTKTGGVWSNLRFTYSGVTYDIAASDVVSNIESKFSSNPYQVNGVLYLYDNLTDGTTSSADYTSGYTTISITKSASLINGIENYAAARTPWIKDEYGTDVFRFWHLSDGTYTNKDVKVAIENFVTRSVDYIKFDVIVRQYDDTDRKPVILEAFYGVNLDPKDINYIGKRIGDAYSRYDTDSSKIVLSGNFANVSKYIRVETSTDVAGRTAAPLASINKAQQIPQYYIAGTSFDLDYPIVTSTTSIMFNHQGYDTSINAIKSLSMPVMLKKGENTSSTVSTFTADFIIPFYGGFDGKNPNTGFTTDATHLMGFDVSSSTAEGVNTYKLALSMLRNTDEFDVDVISIAGVNIGANSPGKVEIFTYALEQVCEYRGDCIVVADVEEADVLDPDRVLNNTADFDSSYGAVYFPAVKIKDQFNQSFPIVPVSTLIPSVIAYTQLVSQPHYAPAGINRGTLNVLQACSKLARDERDDLYSNQINPIATLAGAGTVVWGQKTLQKLASALDRLNVRILINRIKKWVDKYGKQVLFDNNTVTLRQVFTLGVQAYLDSLVLANGLYEYRFLMDDTNNTPETIDRNQLIGQMWLKPTKTMQFIIIPINIVRTDTQL